MSYSVSLTGKLVLIMIVSVPQVRNHSVVTGMAVTKNLHVPMNFPDTVALTRVRRNLSVLCVTDVSCEVTTWPSTLAVTWPPSVLQHGPPTCVSWTKRPLLRVRHHSLLSPSVSSYLPQTRPKQGPLFHLRTISLPLTIVQGTHENQGCYISMYKPDRCTGFLFLPFVIVYKDLFFSFFKYKLCLSKCMHFICQSFHCSFCIIVCYCIFVHKCIYLHECNVYSNVHLLAIYE